MCIRHEKKEKPVMLDKSIISQTQNITSSGGEDFFI